MANNLINQFKTRGSQYNKLGVSCANIPSQLFLEI